MGPEQIAELLDRYGAALVLYARQWCDSPEDVVQTALLKLVRQRIPPDNLIPWLYRVVRNGAIDASRAARRRHKYEAAAADTAPKWFAPSYDPTGLDARAAALALADLPPETREIIVMHVWGCLTFEQIAQALTSSAALSTLRGRAGYPPPEARGRDPDEIEMSKPLPPAEPIPPDPLAVALSKLEPAPHGFDRDALMFAAGRESKAAALSLWKWVAALGLATALFFALLYLRK
jgi:RNA polymerase sigma factor (sigma-70 family)